MLVDGLVFPEGPRWHEGRLWFSDFGAHRVASVGESGDLRTEATHDGPTSGLGWLPDGDLLVVSMTDRTLRRGPGLAVHADLAHLTRVAANDLVVDARGGAYVGSFGFDLDGGGELQPTQLVRVEPDGATRPVGGALHFPNGMVLTPDGGTLVVAETFGPRLTAYSVQDDGDLTDGRVFAELPGIAPDGICLDVEGAVWVATAVTSEVLRVAEGGEVLARVPLTQRSYACMLGGDDGRTLFVCTAPTHEPRKALAERRGRIETVRVDVPHAGLP